MKTDDRPTLAALPRRLLNLARTGWVLIALLTLALFAAGIPARIALFLQNADRRSLYALGMTAATYGILTIVLDFVFILGHYAIALIIFLRRRRDWMALLVALALATNGVLIPLALVYEGLEVHLLMRGALNLVIYLGLVSAITLLYVFPDGRFVPSWTRWLAGLWALLCLPAVFAPQLPISLPAWPLPVQVAIILVWSGVGVFAQIYRFNNVSSPLQRQQVKWGTVGLIAAGMGPLAYFLPFVILPELSQQVVPNILFQRVGSSFFSFSYVMRLIDTAGFNFLTLIFPISFAIAILRYRLWDIDILINRALVYTVLSGALLIVYLVSVLLLEGIVRAVTGQGGNQVVTVVSTLAIAASFAPLRRKVQNTIDRRFYRSRYNAARTVEAFGESLRDEVDLNTLCGRLEHVVEQTMQPEKVSLWLRSVQSKKQ